MKRTVAILLAIIMTACMALTACTNENNVTTSDSDSPIKAGEDPIPEEVRFDGKQVTVLTRSLSSSDTISLHPFASALNGDKLNDEIYNRELRTEERLGIKLEHVVDDSGTEHSPLDRLTLSVQAQLDEYQLAAPNCYSAGNSVYLSQNIFYNLKNRERFPYTDTSAPYYFSEFIDQATYRDALYFVAGDISLDLIGNMFGTFFNKTIAEDVGYGDQTLYGLVRTGQWTIDKQLEIAAAAYTDVTGNGTTDDDVFGLTITNLASLDAYLSAFNMTFVDNKGDSLAYNIDFERHFDICETVYSMIFERKDLYVINNYYYYGGYTDDEAFEIITDKFVNEETLFATMEIEALSSKRVRNMRSDYGILPIPMFDEEQDGYHTSSYGIFSVWAIPTTTAETELSSAVLEYMSFYSYKYVSPTYYNDLLNGQYTRDLDTSKMLDIITGNFKMDFGTIFNFSLNKIQQNTFRYMLNEEKTTNIQRYWKQNHKLFDKRLADFEAIWRKLSELGT